MADDAAGQDDKTEEATPERRDEFRERGEIAVSREVTSVFTLASLIGFLTFYAASLMSDLERFFEHHFEMIATKRIDTGNIIEFAMATWGEFLWMIAPLFMVGVTVAIGITFAQTRLSWSWKRMKPNFGKLNPIKGVANLVSMNAAMELIKSIGKMSAVGIVSWLILYSEWVKVPGLLNYEVLSIFTYWGTITQSLFWAVAALLLLIAGIDYLYNFVSLERKMKMTKQEVKEEFKKREVDPHLKGRMRRMGRDLANKKTLEATKKATVIIANPTHYSVALRYELGMDAPIVVAKGIDFLALRMRDTAKELDIPIVENRPMARELYALVEEGESIPDNMFKAVAEIIRYVFQMKNKALSRS